MSTATSPAVTTEFAVGMRDFYVQQLEKEMPATLKTVEAIPADKCGWKPDPKSRTALDLAWHIVTVDVLFAEQIAGLSFDTMMTEEQALAAKTPKSPKEAADWYRENYPKALGKLKKMTAQQLLTPLNFLGMMTMPAFFYLSFVQNHSVHHRGQLSGYLRPMGGKVPAIYGPSADEDFGM